MEKELGHYVDPKTHDVHHVDEDVENNSIDNLQYLTKKEHRRIHNGWEKIKGQWWKTCTGCDVFQKIEGNFYKRKTGASEFVSHCIPCVKEQVRLSKYKPKVFIINCLICDKEHKTVNRRSLYCSIKCHWVARKMVI